MSIEEVRALVAERQRYDDWLAALEAKRAETPLRVYERVYGDYVGRRGEVLTRLQSHVGTLSDMGRELESRLGELEARLASHEEELAEGMLRNLVGEYDGDRWENVRQDVEAKIAALGHERTALATEVDDVRTLLASARTEPERAVVDAPPKAMEPEAEEPAVEAVVPSEAPEMQRPEADDTSAPVDEVLIEPSFQAATSESHESADALADTAEIAVPALFVHEPIVPALTEVESETGDDSLLDFDVSGIVENPVPQGARHEDVLADVAALFDTSSIAAVPEPQGQGIPSVPSSAAEFDDALAMFGESTSDADAQFLKSLDGIVAEHDTPPRSASRPDSAIATATPPAAGNAGDAFDDLAFLRSVTGSGSSGSELPAPMMSAPAAPVAPTAGTEPQKTLRCTECSTMNLPTEWYCERCGGELAAF